MSRTLRGSSSLLVAVIVACLWSCTRGVFYDEKVWTPGVTARLHCTNSAQYPAVPRDVVPVSWMLPDLAVLDGDQGRMGRFQLLHDNWTLKITNVSVDDLGVYRCLLRTPDYVDWFVLRVGLNAGGPYFRDTWHKYRFHAVTGLSASFGFLLIAVVVYVAYHFCCHDVNSQQPSGELADSGRTGVTVISVVSRADEMTCETTSSSLHGVAEPYPRRNNRMCSTQL